MGDKTEQDFWKCFERYIDIIDPGLKVLRRGQCVFNYMNEYFPEKANEFRGTEIDPYYDDKKIGIFIKKCFGGE